MTERNTKTAGKLIDLMSELKAPLTVNDLCDRCGKEKWQHTGLEKFCPIYSTFRASSPVPPSASSDEPAALAERLKSKRREMDCIRGEIEEIARDHIPDYHFMNYRVSTFWTCEASPVGMCVFKIEDRGHRFVETECRYCGQPVERK